MRRTKPLLAAKNGFKISPSWFLGVAASGSGLVLFIAATKNSGEKITTTKFDVFKEVSEVKPSENIFLGVALMEPRRTELVILGAFIFITQDRISFADRLEFFFSVLTFIPIRMELEGEFPVGLLHFLFGSGFFNA